MPTWYDYERKADEIDESIEAEKSRVLKINCSECKKNIDDEEPVVIGDKRLLTCKECYE